MNSHTESTHLISSMQGDTVSSPPVTGNVSSKPSRRGSRFWLCFGAICSSLALFALELTSVSTALPTIVSDLGTTDFVWIGASYALGSVAFLPMVGGLSQMFGRKPVIVGAIVWFAVGSAMCGAAKTNAVIVAGRTIQGAGGGAIVSLTDILLGDMVPLAERGPFFGLIGLTWSLFCAVGPLIGGGLASASAWRWLFYLNVPVCGICIATVLLFMHFKAPRLTFREKMSRMDWIGNVVVIGSSAAVALGLTWGGIEFAWQSAQVLVPLCLGLSGLLFFLFYEERWAREPIVPFKLMADRTCASGYLQDIFSVVIALAAIYFIPIYYQACKGSSPMISGVQTLGLAAIAPAGVVSGILVGVTHKYRPQLWCGWCLTIIGFVLMSTVGADTPRARMIGFSVIGGSGVGLIYASARFPVQAPQPIGENARTLTLLAFVRAFASIWGITMGNAILQNELRRRLPASFISLFPNGVALAYAIIPELGSLPQPLKDEARAAFAESLAILWKALADLAGGGLLASLLMHEVPLHVATDQEWDMSQEKAESKDGAIVLTETDVSASVI